MLAEGIDAQPYQDHSSHNGSSLFRNRDIALPKESPTRDTKKVTNVMTNTVTRI